jgi:hypothetical protein
VDGTFARQELGLLVQARSAMPRGYFVGDGKLMTERYGRTNVDKIKAARDELRAAIASGDIVRIQAAWDRLEPWIDAPQGLPLDMGAGE